MHVVQLCVCFSSFLWSSQHVVLGKPRLSDRWTIDFKDSLICVLLKWIWLVLIVNCTDVISHLALWLWFTVCCVLSAGDSGSVNWESLPQCNFLLTNDRICAASALMVKKSIHARMFGCSFKLPFFVVFCSTHHYLFISIIFLKLSQLTGNVLARFSRSSSDVNRKFI